MLPLVTRLARQQVGRTRLELELCASEAIFCPLAETQGRRRSQRDADYLIEHVTVAVPADARAGIIPGKQDVDEVIGPHSCKGCRAFTQWLKPFGNRIGRSEARVIEIVSPAEAPPAAIAEPAMEAEGCEIQRIEPADQRTFLSLADDVVLVSEAIDERRIEQQAHEPNSSLSSEGLSSGAS